MAIVMKALDERPAEDPAVRDWEDAMIKRAVSLRRDEVVKLEIKRTADEACYRAQCLKDQGHDPATAGMAENPLNYPYYKPGMGIFGVDWTIQMEES